jgi:hypothetical protein
VAGEGAHLHHSPGADDSHQRPEQEPLVRSDLHPGMGQPLRLFPQPPLHRRDGRQHIEEVLLQRFGKKGSVGHGSLLVREMVVDRVVGPAFPTRGVVQSKLGYEAG